MSRRQGWGVGLVVGLVMSAGTARAQHAVASVPDRAATEDRRAALLSSVLDRIVTVDVHELRMSQTLDSIAARAGIQITYESKVVDASQKVVTLRMHRVRLGAVLDQALVGTGLQVVPVAGIGLGVVQSNETSLQASAVITGRVTNATSKQPIRGATVTLDSASHGTLTDDDGRYRLAVATMGAHRVTVRTLGYARQSRLVTIKDNASLTADFAMQLSSNQLEQVVVTGTVIPTSLKAVPNAITVITSQELEQRGITHIDQLFHGDVPGLYAQSKGSTDFKPGQVSMSSRGSTAFQTSNSGPLSQPIKTYVDGVELADPSYLGLIDPRSIDHIEIIAGPQASTIYGSNAINGVMQVFTKRGSTPKPQLTATLQSGLIQNNFSSAMTPQHDYFAQVSAVDDHISYNAGGSWVHVGSWTPAVNTSTLSGFGGARLEQGPFSADVSVRRTLGSNRQIGTPFQPGNIGSQDGLYRSTIVGTLPKTYHSAAQTLSLRLSYTPVSWWVHSLKIGTDQIAAEVQSMSPAYMSVSDTLSNINNNTTNRTSVSYTSTLKAPIPGLGVLDVTGGADGWHALNTVYSTNARTLTGTLSGTSYLIARQPDHDHGAFVQAQLSIRDALFFTYGLRAEWNPGYGADANPNTVPRYGVAYTRDVGEITAKVRASYGHSTRPPLLYERKGCYLGDPTCGETDQVQFYGNPYLQLPNPQLLPDQQQGWEGGFELYYGKRASLVVTRYNQTIDNLSLYVIVDSLDELPAVKAYYGDHDWQYPLRQSQYVNMGSVRNQGWDLQGTINLGPFTTQGTYSWIKSRVIGVTPAFRAQFPVTRFPQYAPGAVFTQFPEHTYAVSVQYAHANTTIGVNVQGQGLLYVSADALTYAIEAGRLPVTSPRMDDPRTLRRGPGYALADLNASQRLSSHFDALLQIQNLANYYQSDLGFNVASIGRQTKLGARIRW